MRIALEETFNCSLLLECKLLTLLFAIMSVAALSSAAAAAAAFSNSSSSVYVVP
jgi:hypothetical protein